MSALLERELDLAGLPMPANPISTASPLVTVTLLQESPELVSILPVSVARVFERHGMLRDAPDTYEVEVADLRHRHAQGRGAFARRAPVRADASGQRAAAVKARSVCCRKASKF